MNEICSNYFFVKIIEFLMCFILGYIRSVLCKKYYGLWGGGGAWFYMFVINGYTLVLYTKVQHNYSMLHSSLYQSTSEGRDLFRPFPEHSQGHGVELSGWCVQIKNLVFWKYSNLNGILSQDSSSFV